MCPRPRAFTPRPASVQCRMSALSHHHHHHWCVVLLVVLQLHLTTTATTTATTAPVLMGIRPQASLAAHEDVILTCTQVNIIPHHTE